MSNSTKTTGMNKHLTMTILESGFPFYFNKKEVKCCFEMLGSIFIFANGRIYYNVLSVTRERRMCFQNNFIMESKVYDASNLAVNATNRSKPPYRQTSVISVS
jgi:hypothetical protein